MEFEQTGKRAATPWAEANLYANVDVSIKSIIKERQWGKFNRNIGLMATGLGAMVGGMGMPVFGSIGIVVATLPGMAMMGRGIWQILVAHQHLWQMRQLYHQHITTPYLRQKTAETFAENLADLPAPVRSIIKRIGDGFDKPFGTHNPY